MGKTKGRDAAKVSLMVEAWPLDRAKPYPGNPRRITAEAIAKVRKSLLEYGWRQPIVVCAKSEIVVGHTRRLAAIEIHQAGESIPNWADTSTMPVHPSGMDETEARAYRLADNRTGEDIEWDMDLLHIEFEALDEADFDLDLTGFEEIEVLAAAGEAMADAEAAWQGMPEYDNEDLSAYASVRVNFASDADMERFFELVEQKRTPKIRAIWFPEAKVERMSDKAFVDADA